MRKKILLGIMFFSLFLTACSYKEDNRDKSVDNNQIENSETRTDESLEQDKDSDNNKANEMINNNLDKNGEENNTKDSQRDRSTENMDNNAEENWKLNNSSSNKKKESLTENNNITEKVKNYIIDGQKNKSEADKIKWSQTFLNQVDIDSLYKQYISKGGSPNDLEQFAKYITLNAPILKNWKELFEKDLYNKYEEEVVRLEHLEDDLYQAYIKKDGKEVPYVVVSSRTGYFHG